MANITLHRVYMIMNITGSIQQDTFYFNLYKTDIGTGAGTGGIGGEAGDEYGGATDGNLG